MPRFNDVFAQLVEDGDGFVLSEAGVGFCTRGIMSQRAFAAQLEAEGQSPEAALAIADYIQIKSSFPVEADPYWTQQNECTFNGCQAQYGNADAPLEPRDLRIVEASEDSLQLVPRAAGGTPRLKCCFPGVVEFRVRTGNQWTVVGDRIGFMHSVTTTDEGLCRPSCDPTLATLNGRAFEATAEADNTFGNPFFGFVINSSGSSRDMHFEFSTRGAFDPLSLSVVTNNPDVQPTNVRYLTSTGELVVSDGSLQGITLLDLNALVVTRQYQ